MTGAAGKRVLITGATGFVGSNLVRRSLEQNAEVHVLLRRSSDPWRIAGVLGDVRVHYADLADRAGIVSVAKAVRPDVVFHTAIYGGRPSENDTDTIMASNFLGTVNLVNALQGIDYELLVNTGSSSEYGVKPGPMAEVDAPEPADDYGVSKAAATLYCRMAALRDRKPIVTLRLFSPYGYYDDPGRLIPSVILSCLAGRTPKVSSPRFVRDFIFIEDVVDAYFKLLGAGKARGGIFNVGFGVQRTVGEVVGAILKIMGGGASADWGNEGKRAHEPDAWQADVSRLKETVGWTPHNDLDGGLRRTVEWFRGNIRLYQER